MKVTVPLPEGRAASVEATTMSELVAGLTALGFSSPSWDKNVIRHWDSRLAGNWGPYSQSDCDVLADELATVRRVAQAVYTGPCLEPDPEAGENQ
jgi:hypothetical protein